MSELKSRHVIDVYDYYAEKPCEERSQVYLKSEVDASIDELKQKLAEKESWVKMLGEGEAALSLELEKTKQDLEDAKATAYTESVDAGMENRRLKRALWMARAYRGRDNSILLPSKFMRNVWDKVERKCRAKMEEYK